jgi:hypothetical protein
MPNVFSAAEFLKTHPPAFRVFNAVAREQTVSGWSLARSLTIDPDELEPILRDLQSLGLIQADDAPGLDAFVFLSDIGFQLGSLKA